MAFWPFLEKLKVSCKFESTRFRGKLHKQKFVTRSVPISFIIVILLENAQEKIFKFWNGVSDPVDQVIYAWRLLHLLNQPSRGRTWSRRLRRRGTRSSRRSLWSRPAPASQAPACRDWRQWRPYQRPQEVKGGRRGGGRRWLIIICKGLSDNFY